MRKVGTGNFKYEEICDWAKFPEGVPIPDVPGVAVDSQDRVFILARTNPPVMVFDRDGRLRATWGDGLFKRPHYIYLGPDDSVYVVDDVGHAIHKFTPEGKLLMTIETASHPADTGYVPVGAEGYAPGKPNIVKRAGPPFNTPTGVALSSTGELFVTDGYGNARVHKFTADGKKLLLSWGEPGTGQGQFVQPHGVWVDDTGRVYISDRQNVRIQIFDSQGAFLTQWDDVHFPDNICIDKNGNVYVAEVGCVWLRTLEPDLTKPPARITIRNLNGTIIAEWGEENPYQDGMFFAPHGIAVDSRGDVYVSEVTESYNRGNAPVNWPVLRKYVKC
ncbi:MAG: peptidyl-alpha-hydroxyglycine alpha-amidating lyase family protein [Proteobacteria bacterium]|nr:peptidyl-alpha-hydroxyglycine alpha-amidating lyase family protein [Pseudomonadota bacterium]